VLLIADPGAPAATAKRIAKTLPDSLNDHVDGSWRASVRVEPFLPDEQLPFGEVVQSVDPSRHDEDVVVYITDLPRRDGTLPIIADISVEDRFGLISMPSVGATFVAPRVAAIVQLVIAETLAAPDLKPTRADRLRRTEADRAVRYLASTGFRRMRLLAGMVRANRPWRLATGLSRSLAGAFATGAVGIATITIWQFSDTMGPWRLSAATVLSIGAMVAWLVLDHELWEHPHSDAERERAALYNVATLVTLALGVAVMHIALFILLLLTCWLVLPPVVVERYVGHSISVANYLTLAWLLASIATVGGALGSGLEDREAVKAAAYGARQRQRFEDST
jgi:hypothetical protein